MTLSVINLLFFFFISSCLLSSILVIISRNPVHSIIFLILSFFNVVFILLLQRIEFLAAVFLIVYIGAIAVLFLFVVYMLNIRMIELNKMNNKYLIYISCVFACLLFFLLLNFRDDFYICFSSSIAFEIFSWNIIDYSNLFVLSFFLYCNFFFYLVIISIILLVAMIGSIVITSRRTFYLREQNIFTQNRRLLKNGIK